MHNFNFSLLSDKLFNPPLRWRWVDIMNCITILNFYLFFNNFNAWFCHCEYHIHFYSLLTTNLIWPSFYSSYLFCNHISYNKSIISIYFFLLFSNEAWIVRKHLTTFLDIGIKNHIIFLHNKYHCLHFFIQV